MQELACSVSTFSKNMFNPQQHVKHMFDHRHVYSFHMPMCLTEKSYGSLSYDSLYAYNCLLHAYYLY